MIAVDGGGWVRIGWGLVAGKECVMQGKVHVERGDESQRIKAAMQAKE